MAGGRLHSRLGRTCVLKKLPANPRDLVTVAAMLVIVAATLLFARTRDTSFQLLTANGISYPEATVTRVVAEDLTPEEGTGRFLGSQTLEVRIESGEFAGETVEAVNNLAADHNVLGRAGERVIIKAERQEGVNLLLLRVQLRPRPGERGDSRGLLDRDGGRRRHKGAAQRDRLGVRPVHG